MARRASSNLSLVPARIFSWVCGGEAGGGARRFSVATRATGRRGFTTFGAETATSGSSTVPPLEDDGACDVVGAAAGVCGDAGACDGAGAGAGVCARAGPPKLPSSNEATPEAANICLLNTDITSEFRTSDEAAAGLLLVSEFDRGLAVDGRRTDFDDPAGSVRAMRRSLGPIDRSMSGDRRSARLKRDADRVQMDELGIGGQVQELYRLRQFQQWRRRKQHRVGHRDDGADRAGITAVVVGGGLLLLLLSLDGLSCHIRCGKSACNVRRGRDSRDTRIEWRAPPGPRPRGNARTTIQPGSPAPAARASIHV